MIPNEQQKEVIEHFEGPCVVLAVPGSGKTASLTERVNRLIQRGVDPKKILAITFTNKAAAEMKERIAKVVGREVAVKMTICTFHSLCSRIIRSNCSLLGLSDSYSIYDDAQQQRLLKTCISKIESVGLKEEYKPTKKYMNSIKGFIEGKRNACLTDDEALRKYDLSGNQFDVVQEYFTQLKRANAVDFTGLLSETLKLFDENSEVAKKYSDRFQFISVDEVQDTNIAQYRLIKHLGKHGNVLVVGDIDQSLYSFRNACPDNVFSFEKEFSNCKVLFLEKNYRSTPEILMPSQRLIDNNKMRKPTTLKTDNGNGFVPKIIAGENDIDMASKIAYEIKQAIGNGVPPYEIAVLFRTNHSSRVLESALRMHMIKYKLIGGLSFWERQEVKWAIGILKLLCNPNDRMSFELTCEACCRGIGDKALSVIADNSHINNISTLDAARLWMNNSKAGKGLIPLFEALDGSKGMAPGESLIYILNNTAMANRVEAKSTDTNDRLANVKELALDVDRYCSSPKSTLAGYLQNIMLLTGEDQEVEDDKKMVRLMTLHGSKGLEFDFVLISHCNEGILPHYRVESEAKTQSELENGIEEERRILYVGMTRAKKKLLMYFAKTMPSKYGRSVTYHPVEPSRYLIETGLSLPIE